MINLKVEKQQLRAVMLEMRNGFSASEKAAAEKRVCDQLINLIKEQKAKVVHSFLPMGKELNHTPVIEFCLANQITVITTKTLPKSTLQHLVLADLNDLENGVFGTKYPRNAKEWTGTYDLIIVPGLAFDSDGNRLGYGGGYYDAFTKNHPRSWKVAVAFPFQLVNRVPVEQFDQKVDSVLT
jgi:5-formyltetrahydrofolate cyclo-ligase